jgi:hypothetical protein
MQKTVKGVVSRGPRLTVTFDRKLLESARRDAEYTWQEVATNADVDAATVWRARNGIKVSLKAARNICSALGCSTEQLEVSSDKPSPITDDSGTPRLDSTDTPSQAVDDLAALLGRRAMFITMFNQDNGTSLKFLGEMFAIADIAFSGLAEVEERLRTTIDEIDSRVRAMFQEILKMPNVREKISDDDLHRLLELSYNLAPDDNIFLDQEGEVTLVEGHFRRSRKRHYASTDRIGRVQR